MMKAFVFGCLRFPVDYEYKLLREKLTLVWHKKSIE